MNSDSSLTSSIMDFDFDNDDTFMQMTTTMPKRRHLDFSILAKTQPMPEETAILDYKAEFTTRDFYMISRPLIPEDMDDQWLMYVREDTLFIHRSWTGTCVYTVDFVLESDKYKVSRAVVNRSPDQYRAGDVDYDEKLLDYLINRLLLGKCIPFPQSQEQQHLKTPESSGLQFDPHYQHTCTIL